MRELTGGPDAARYIALAQRRPVPRPFHLRWLIPSICRTSPRRWWAMWVMSWPVLAAGMYWWAVTGGWRVALGSAVLLLALPGILGPKAVIPVGVDMPATALTVVAAAAWSHHLVWPALILVAVAAAVRETSPVWLSLWLWTPLPLVALAVPLIRHLTTHTGPDPLGPVFDGIAAHPIRSAMEAHKGRWRDGWLLVAPWGACLAALYRPSLPLVVLLAVAYCQLLIATDTVRLYQHAAGPAVALAAARVIPVPFLALVCVAHVVWWRTPERI